MGKLEKVRGGRRRQHPRGAARLCVGEMGKSHRGALCRFFTTAWDSTGVSIQTSVGKEKINDDFKTPRSFSPHWSSLFSLSTPVPKNIVRKFLFKCES